MGFGLRTIEALVPGDFVMEYVGEVIDQEELNARVKLRGSRNTTNWYITQLTEELYIDAGRRGNLARFMNHSCDPNCEIQKWEVQGLPRLGIFARRDIRPGEELTFKYDFKDLPSVLRSACKCQAPHCCGFVGGLLNGTGQLPHPSRSAPRRRSRAQ